jgi:hypothetical protein
VIHHGAVLGSNAGRAGVLSLFSFRPPFSSPQFFTSFFESLTKLSLIQQPPVQMGLPA